MRETAAEYVRFSWLSWFNQKIITRIWRCDVHGWAATRSTHITDNNSSEETHLVTELSAGDTCHAVPLWMEYLPFIWQTPVRVTHNNNVTVSLTTDQVVESSGNRLVWSRLNLQLFVSPLLYFCFTLWWFNTVISILIGFFEILFFEA